MASRMLGCWGVEGGSEIFGEAVSDVILVTCGFAALSSDVMYRLD
jgi:hypothetical protein